MPQKPQKFYLNPKLPSSLFGQKQKYSIMGLFCCITWYNLFGRRFRNPMVIWRPNYVLKNYPGLFLRIVGLVNRNICSKFEMWSKI